MAGGSVTIRKDVSGTLVVDITSAAGGTPTFYSDAALTASVSFPDSITTSKTYYIGVNDQYVLSVLRDGVEIANSPDGTRSFRLEDTHLSVSPGPDASDAESGTGGASLSANNAFTGTNSFAAATAVAAGTAALPGVYPTGDTNTGIWSPAADTLAVSTGGTERMRIDNAGLITGTGTSLGAWTAYTPTLGGTGWAIGDGTAAGYYCKIGKTVRFRAQITFGGTSTYDAANYPTISLPVTAVSGTGGNFQFGGYYRDASTGSAYRANPLLLSTTAVRMMAMGTNGVDAFVTSANPFTWVSTDIIQLHGTYEAA